ncbi:DUF3016 domain-containing protein [Methylopila henanensis]|uniref:DUF3016 domain-containing protein n=1 Tax=Methylopila henanensis TaxID=873516 RepID=A0ABW4K9V4_9HYPH
MNPESLFGHRAAAIVRGGAGALAAAAVVALSPAPVAAGEAVVRVARQPGVDTLAFRSARERDAAFAALSRHLARLAETRLPAGQSVTIELIDLRPAGQFEPWRTNFQDVRVLRDVTPPRVTLSYVLKERGRTLARGRETLSDMNYLANPSARSSLSSWPYEKELLSDWFRSRLVLRRPAP